METIEQIKNHCVSGTAYDDGGRNKEIAERATELAVESWPINALFVAGADEQTERKFMRKAERAAEKATKSKLKKDCLERYGFAETVLLLWVLSAIVSWVVKKIADLIWNGGVTQHAMLAMGCCGEAV